MVRYARGLLGLSLSGVERPSGQRAQIREEHLTIDAETRRQLEEFGHAGASRPGQDGSGESSRRDSRRSIEARLPTTQAAAMTQPALRLKSISVLLAIATAHFGCGGGESASDAGIEA